MSATAMVRVARTEEEWLRCFPVLAELRPHLQRDAFVERVRRQEREGGYHMAFVEDGGEIKSVAGYRFSENLAWGTFLYVDDLVTSAQDRSRGYGEQLFEWLVERAREKDCDELHLDSGVQRFGAHRFYLAQRLDLTSHHFALKLR
jgi:GNAT superfamily N-acetyltransferase